MSKLVEEVKRGASSVASTVKGAFKGDVKDILRLATGGASASTEGSLKLAGKAIGNPFIPPPTKIPSLSQSNTSEAAPDVDLASTESSRRRSGAAVGTRKLRVPLGGLK